MDATFHVNSEQDIRVMNTPGGVMLELLKVRRDIPAGEWPWETQALACVSKPYARAIASALMGAAAEK